jgi:hypothetical protein
MVEGRGPVAHRVLGLEASLHVLVRVLWDDLRMQGAEALGLFKDKGLFNDKGLLKDKGLFKDKGYSRIMGYSRTGVIQGYNLQASSETFRSLEKLRPTGRCNLDCQGRMRCHVGATIHPK